MLSRIKYSDGLKEAHAIHRIGYAIDGIQRESGDPDDWYSPLKINAFIHKVVLSGVWNDIQVDYKKLWTVFEALYVDNEFVPSKRMPGYKTRLIRQSPEFQINIYMNPIENRPPYMIEIIPREHSSINDWKALFKKIHLWFPNIKISLVDYAIDEYCYDFHAAEKLFRVQLKHLFIPYQRKAFTYGGDLVQYGERTRMNSVCRIDDAKMYERGPDHKKKGLGWIMKDVDRVRLEYSAPRQVLVNHGISVIGDLIRHPRFYEINKGLYKFRHFKGSKILPKLGHAYTIRDKNGNIGCFQSEVIGHRKHVKNINRYMNDIEEFETLKSALWDAMKRFDQEW